MGDGCYQPPPPEDEARHTTAGCLIASMIGILSWWL